MIEDLAGRWDVRQAASTDALAEAAGAGEWLEAAVPGCIHLDLMKAGKIPDPFYGFNDLEVQWVAEANWLYRRIFGCAAELARMKRVELVCRGLDTFGHVVLNGKELGRTDNMFVEWRWDVTGLLRADQNELLVLFESPKKVGEALLARHGKLPIWDRESPQRAYTRKAQYASGWDWGPNLNTSGIWLPIFLEGHGRGRIADVWARVDWAKPSVPVVKASVELDAIEPCAATVKAELTGPGPRRTASASARLQAGANAVELAVCVPDPHLWWPAGFGAPDLYHLEVSAKLGDEALEAAPVQVGLRRVELRREKDDEGESFVICVNDVPIFCKGANWVPADSFLPRVTRRDYDELVQIAADANMNMLRVWGGGIYERDEFFDACDRLGILVWHDFAFACSAYPDNLDWFCRSVRTEAEQNVRRLRNHPSLVLWCGNNENHQLLQQARSQAGIKIYEDILPDVCARLDPARPYWPGSPYGGADPNDPTQGDQHYWSMWHGWAHPRAQRHYRGRFIDEFGIQAPPALETVRSYIPSSGHFMQSRAMEHHDRCHEGTDKLYRYLATFFRVPADFADTIYLMQLAQAEAVKMGVESWRSRKFRTAGAIFWQFNDCWPVTSWSCLDWVRRPKALYYYARRFFAPVLPVIDRRDGRFTVTVVNDRPTDFEGELICGCGTLDGEQDWVDRHPVAVAANGTDVAQVKREDELDLREPDRRYFWCRLIETGREIARNSWPLLPYKHMQLEVPEWHTEVTEAGQREFSVQISTETFAKAAWLRVDGMEAKFSDNYMDVLPEVPVRFSVSTPMAIEARELHRRLRIRSAADAQQGRPELR